MKFLLKIFIWFHLGSYKDENKIWKENHTNSHIFQFKISIKDYFFFPSTNRELLYSQKKTEAAAGFLRSS